MGEQGQGQQPEQDRAARERAAKARLVFGDPLDRQSSDDTDRGWGERPSGGSGGAGGSAGTGDGGRERGLDWYLSQRPPHHGD